MKRRLLEYAYNYFDPTTFNDGEMKRALQKANERRAEKASDATSSGSNGGSDRRGKGKLKFELMTSYNILSATVVCKEYQGNTFAPGSCSASVNVSRVHCKVFLQSMAATSCYIRSYPLIDSITLTIPYLSKYSLESEAIFKYIHQCENENEK